MRLLKLSTSVHSEYNTKFINEENNKILVLIYNDVDGYPPTINLINEFSVRLCEVYLLHLAEKDFQHSDVTIAFQKKVIKNNNGFRILSNYFSFFLFTKNAFNIIRKNRINKIIVFDAYSLLCVSLFRVVLKPLNKMFIWYHNHDAGSPSYFKKLSLGWFAHIFEKRGLKEVDFFTLPSKERNTHFPTKKMDFLLPNYPSIRIYNKFNSILKERTKRIKLIFQGRITPGHGIEPIIKLMKDSIKGYRLQLVLKGMITKEYKDHLIKLSERYGVNKNIEFHGYTDYEELPFVTAQCNIGIAIHSATDSMHSTLGTASNKIYEYAACGLPILYYDSDHFNKYLENYEWAFPVLEKEDSIRKALLLIMENYNYYSKCAKKEFLTNLNYESFFDRAFNMLKQKIF